jgi:hypothetical protein
VHICCTLFLAYVLYGAAGWLQHPPSAVPVPKALLAAAVQAAALPPTGMVHSVDQKRSAVISKLSGLTNDAVRATQARLFPRETAMDDAAGDAQICETQGAQNASQD